MISKLGLTFTLNECKPPVPVRFINFNFIGFRPIMPVKILQGRSDNPSNNEVSTSIIAYVTFI